MCRGNQLSSGSVLITPRKQMVCETRSFQQLWKTFFSDVKYIFIHFPIFIESWYTSLYKFKVYSMIYTYKEMIIMGSINIHHLMDTIKRKGEKRKKIFSLWWKSSGFTLKNFPIYHTAMLATVTIWYIRFFWVMNKLVVKKFRKI